MKHIQTYNRTINLPYADLPILDSLAHSLGIVCTHWHAIPALLHALGTSQIVLTSAATPPPYNTNWMGKVSLRDPEFRTLIRLCAEFELYGRNNRPSLSVLLHALAVGSATVERFADPTAVSPFLAPPEEGGP